MTDSTGHTTPSQVRRQMREIAEHIRNQESTERNIMRLAAEFENKEHQDMLMEILVREELISNILDLFIVTTDKSLCWTALKLLCITLQADFFTDLDAMDARMARTFIDCLATPVYRYDAARALRYMATKSTVTKQLLRDQHVAEAVLKSVLSYQSYNDCCSVNEMMAEVYDLGQKHRVFRIRAKDTTKYLYCVALWIAGEQLASKTFEDSPTMLERMMPLISNTLMNIVDEDADEGDLVCRVLIQFFTKPMPNKACKVLSAGIVPHIVKLLDSTRPYVAVSALRCIELMARFDQDLSREFVQCHVVEKLRLQSSGSEIAERGFGVLSAMLTVGLAPQELGLSDRVFAAATFWLQNASAERNIRLSVCLFRAILICNPTGHVFPSVNLGDVVDHLCQLLAETDPMNTLEVSSLLAKLENCLEAAQARGQVGEVKRRVLDMDCVWKVLALCCHEDQVIAQTTRELTCKVFRYVGVGHSDV